MESPLLDIRMNLNEMLNKFNGFDPSYHMRFKYNVFDISINIISINIEKLTKGAENSIIRTYNNEKIPSLLENLKISVSYSNNEETLSNIITLYQTLLIRDTLRSSIHAEKIIKSLKNDDNPELLPTFYFNKEIYNDLYDFFGIIRKRIEIEKIKRKLSEIEGKYMEEIKRERKEIERIYIEEMGRKKMEDIDIEEMDKWERERREREKRERREREEREERERKRREMEDIAREERERREREEREDIAREERERRERNRTSSSKKSK